MEESNFRFYGFGQDSSQPNSIFYNDVFLLMNQRRSNPTISILISIENENDFIANSFWADNRVIELLTNAGAKAIRIKKESQQTEYQQFNELFHVNSFPSLYVFGPSSSAPSFIYSDTYPDYQKFASDFSTLTYTPAPIFQPPQPSQPQTSQEQQPQQLPNQQPENTSLSQSKPPEQQNTSQPTPQHTEQKQPQQPKQSTQQSHNLINEDEYVRRRTKTQPQQQQKPKKEVSEIPIEVTVTTHDKKVHTDTFKSTDNCLTIRVWVSKLIGKPHTEYKLIVIPGDFILPLSDRVFLRQYAPKLNLRVELIGANNQQKRSSNKFLQTIRNFIENISIFADPEDDPADFWRTQPVYRNNQHRK